MIDRAKAGKAVPDQCRQCDHNNLLRAVIEGTTDAIFVKDHEGRYIMCNASVSQIMGRPTEEIIGHHDNELFPVETAHKIEEDDNSVLAGGEPLQFETRIPIGETLRTFLSTKAACRDEQGKFVGIIGISRDITERKRAEAALRETNQTLQALIQASPLPIISFDRKARVRRWNPAAERIFGWDESEVLGGPPPFVSEEKQHEFRQNLKRALAGEAISGLEIRRQKKDGSPVDIAIWTAPLWDAAGKVSGVMSIVADLTDRKQAELALKEGEERLARILESAMDAIVTVDQRQIVRLFNSAAEDVFRCSASEVIGQRFERFCSKALRDLLDRCMRGFRRAGRGKRYLWAPEGITAVRADGNEFPVEATISQSETSGEKLFTIILRDVNDRKRAEDQLRKLQLENVYLREAARAHPAFGEIVGDSDAIRKVLDSVEKVAGTDSTVLLRGETGTGKELVARAIHNRSLQKNNMLVTVNCATLPSGLIESELFGHEKGAFTGAVSKKIGRFEMADGGTIFLDEIGDVPLELQAKLLRVLQEGEFERLGQTTTHKVNVRVIAATNRDLEQAVEQGRFRADLYYRLNVFPIHIPALRERKEDLPELIRHFTRKYASKMAKQISSIPDSLLNELVQYDWPGNVRELENVVERAVIITQGPQLELGDWHPAPSLNGHGLRSFKLEEIERQHILKVLKLTNWRVSGDKGAARLLGMKPTTLESKMKKLGIKRDTRQTGGA